MAGLENMFDLKKMKENKDQEIEQQKAYREMKKTELCIPNYRRADETSVEFNRRQSTYVCEYKKAKSTYDFLIDKTKR